MSYLKSVFFTLSTLMLGISFEASALSIGALPLPPKQENGIDWHLVGFNEKSSGFNAEFPGIPNCRVIKDIPLISTYHENNYYEMMILPALVEMENTFKNIKKILKTEKYILSTLNIDNDYIKNVFEAILINEKTNVTISIQRVYQTADTVFVAKVEGNQIDLDLASRFFEKIGFFYKNRNRALIN